MSQTHCKLCGSSAISTDEVEYTGSARADSLLLAECLRCESRWTQPLFADDLGGRRPRLGLVRHDAAQEVASAA